MLRRSFWAYCVITSGVGLVFLIALNGPKHFHEYVLQKSGVTSVTYDDVDDANTARRLLTAMDDIEVNKNHGKDSQLNPVVIGRPVPLLVTNYDDNSQKRSWNTTDVISSASQENASRQTMTVTHSPENAEDKGQTPGSKVKRLPTALIAGAPKAGTGALMSFLSQHPAVAMPEQEINFFDRQAFISKGPDWYRHKMVPSYPWQVTMEKSPYYYTSRLAVQRIKEFNPDMKIIVTCSDPIHRALSHYVHMSLSFSLPGKQPEMYMNFSEIVISKTGTVNPSRGEISHSTYVNPLMMWFKLFHREQLLFVDGTAISKEPWTEFEKVEKFLGLKPFLTKDRFVMNQERGLYCIRLDSGEDFCLPEWKGRKHPDVEEWVLDKLKTYFRPLNEAFFRKIGHRMSWGDNVTVT